MIDDFDVDICELCKHNEYFSYLDSSTYRVENDSRCLKGHERCGDILDCDDFEKELEE